MWLKELVRDPETTTEKPFNEDDIGREPYIKLLTEHLTSGDSPNVIALNGGWGSGKTVFVKMWKAYLENQNYVALYFNAWDCDYCDDPLIPFLAGIGNQINEAVPNLRNKETKKMIEAGKAFLKTGFFNAVKMASSGLVDLEEINKSLVDQRFKDFSDREKEIADFKKALSGLIKAIGELTKNKKKTPIFIFVDELDRCKPSFAIRLLERIKHLFDVDGFVFVLSIAGEQLEHSINAVYGSAFDARGYLRRFFDYEYFLPEGKEDSLDEWTKRVFAKAAPYDLFLPELKDILASQFIALSKIYGADARTQRQILQQFFFLLAPFDEQFATPHLFLFLLFLQRYDQAAFDFFRDGKYTDSEDFLRNFKQKSSKMDALHSFLRKDFPDAIKLKATIIIIVERKLDRYIEDKEKEIIKNENDHKKSPQAISDESSKILKKLLEEIHSLKGQPGNIKDRSFYFNRLDMIDELAPRIIEGKNK